MRISINIETDNAAFGTDASDKGCEVGRILSNLGAALSARGLEEGDEGRIRDLNGNTVGRWYVEG